MTSSSPPVLSATEGLLSKASGLFAAAGVVLTILTTVRGRLGPWASPGDLGFLRVIFLQWGAIGLLAFLRRRSLAPLLGAGRGEAWAAAFAGAYVTWAANELYFRHLGALPGAPLSPFPVPAAAAFFLGIGMFEELGFRGVVLEGLRGAFPRWAAHALTILAFAAVHFRPAAAWPPLLLMGLFFGLLREYGRSLWPCVGAHALINFHGMLRGLV